MTVRNNRKYNAMLGATVSREEPSPRASVAIRGVWLLREGAENDPLARAVVMVELTDGTSRRVIDELLTSAFSHYVTAVGMQEAPMGFLPWNRKG